MVEIGGSPSTGAYIFLHEVGHTLGAVQHSAPHSSGAGHCYTGSDVMCYADGGPWFAGGGHHGVGLRTDARRTAPVRL